MSRTGSAVEAGAETHTAPVGVLIGAATAVFLIVGRWGPARFLSSDVPWGWLIEPRLWFAFLLLVLALGSLRLPSAELRSSDRLVVVCVFSLLSWLAFSIGWTPVPAIAGAKVYELGLSGVVVGSLLAMRRRMWFDRDLWTWVVVLTGFMGALGIVGFLAGGGGRLAVLAGGPNVFGRIVGLLTLIAVHAAVTRRKKAVRWGVVAAFAGMLVVLSGSRGAMLATIAALLVVVWSNREHFRRMTGAALLLATAAFVAVRFSPLGRAVVAAFRLRIITLTLEEHHTSGRVELYRDAIAAWKESPLFGRGVQSFQGLGYGVYPHNIFLEVLLEGGVVAGILLAIPVLVLLWRIVRGGVTSDLAAAAAVLLLVAAQFSGDMFDSRGLLLFLIIAVIRPPGRAPVPADGE